MDIRQNLSVFRNEISLSSTSAGSEMLRRVISAIFSPPFVNILWFIGVVVHFIAKWCKCQVVFYSGSLFNAFSFAFCGVVVYSDRERREKP